MLVPIHVYTTYVTLENFCKFFSLRPKEFQGTVAISDNAPSQPFKGKDRRIFLFEQSAIIADCILPKKEFGNPTYIFKSQIMVNKVSLCKLTNFSVHKLSDGEILICV